jgi:hypothetical protein
MITQTKTNDYGIRQLTDLELDAVNGGMMGLPAASVPGVMLMGLPLLVAGAAGALLSMPFGGAW